MWQILWGVNLEVVHPWSSLPRCRRVACERATGADYQSEGKWRRSEEHCIFHYTLSGEGRVRIDGNSLPVRTGEGFLSVINHPQSGYGYPQGLKDPWEFIWFGFAGGQSREMVFELLRKAGPVFRIAPEHAVIQRLLVLEARHGQRLELDAVRAAEWVFELLLALGGTLTPQAARPAAELLTNETLRQIEQGLAQGLTVKRLASQLGVSREHLTRKYGKLTGLSLREHIQERKIGLACRWLKNSAWSVKEIAARLEYSSDVSFCRAFRRKMKLTPGQFRRHGTLPLFAVSDEGAVGTKNTK